MKKIFTLTAIFFTFLAPAYAQLQTGSQASVSLAVVMPSNIDGLSESILSRLESKITEAVTNNGLSADGYTQNFVIYPKFSITGEQQSKGGLRSITLVNCTLSLFIKQLAGNLIFSSYSKSLQGSGYSREDALNNAINQVNPADNDISAFIEKGKAKIISYYQAKCGEIIARAEADRGLKKFENALATLLSVPPEAAGCYAQAQAKAKIVFAELQKNNCQQYLQKTRSLASAQDYDGALQYASWVDASGPCAAESKKLIASIADKVSEEKKQEWQFLLKTYTDGVALEKARINAMSNLAAAYARAQQKTVVYTTVIQ